MKKESELECYLYFMWNDFCDYYCNKIFGEKEGRILYNIYLSCCDRCHHEGAAATFYQELSENEREKLVQFAVKYYND